MNKSSLIANTSGLHLVKKPMQRAEPMQGLREGSTGRFVSSGTVGPVVVMLPRVMAVGEPVLEEQAQEEALPEAPKPAENSESISPSATTVAPVPQGNVIDGGAAQTSTSSEKGPTQAAALAARQNSETSTAVIQDAALLEEARDRLFEQNLDPGGVGTPAMDVAIRKFERQAGLPESGRLTDGVLQSLREADTLKPWGAIIVTGDAKRWGMSWGRPSRRQALDEAKARCGSDQCTRDLAFFGKRCGAFALSSQSWSVTWRNGGDIARKTALGECAKGGQGCRLIGAVCADGSDRTD